MLPKSLLVIAATALSFGYVTRTTATLNISDRYRNSVLALGPPFRIVIDNLLDPNDKNYWYLAPDARRVYGTTKAGVYNFATDTPSGQIFTGGKAVCILFIFFFSALVPGTFHLCRLRVFKSFGWSWEEFERKRG